MKEFLLLTSLLLLQGKLYGRQPMADYTPILKMESNRNVIIRALPTIDKWQEVESLEQ